MVLQKGGGGFFVNADDDCVDDDGDGDLVLHATDEVQFLLSGTNKISVPFAFN